MKSLIRENARQSAENVERQIMKFIQDIQTWSETIITANSIAIHRFMIAASVVVKCHTIIEEFRYNFNNLPSKGNMWRNILQRAANAL